MSREIIYPDPASIVSIFAELPSCLWIMALRNGINSLRVERRPLQAAKKVDGGNLHISISDGTALLHQETLPNKITGWPVSLSRELTHFGTPP